MNVPGSVRPSWILVHGWASSSAIWTPVIQRLDVECLTLPLPGHVGIETDGLEALPESLVLIGWSLGGLQAIDLAWRLGKRVKALVLVAASPCFTQRPDWRQAMPAADLERFGRDLREDKEACLRRFMALQCLGDARAAKVRAALRAALPEPLPGWRELAWGLAQLAERDLRSRLVSLACPVQVILGQCDSLIPARQARELAALDEGIGVTVMPGAAHLPFVSDSDAFVHHLIQGPAANV